MTTKSLGILSPIQTSDIFVVLRADTVCGEEGKYAEKKVKLTKLKVIF